MRSTLWGDFPRKPHRRVWISLQGNTSNCLYSNRHGHRFMYMHTCMKTYSGCFSCSELSIVFSSQSKSQMLTWLIRFSMIWPLFIWPDPPGQSALATLAFLLFFKNMPDLFPLQGFCSCKKFLSVKCSSARCHMTHCITINYHCEACLHPSIYYLNPPPPLLPIPCYPSLPYSASPHSLQLYDFYSIDLLYFIKKLSYIRQDCYWLLFS